VSDFDAEAQAGSPQGDDLGFRAAMPPQQRANAVPADDGLGFRPAQSARAASDDDGLGFRPAEPPAQKTPPIKPFGTSELATPNRAAISPGIAPDLEQPYHAVPGLFGRPMLTEESKQRLAANQISRGQITAGKSGVGGWLQNLEGDIRSGTGTTAPGRVLRAMGAPGTESGVSPTVGETIGGPLIGPVRVAAGLKQALGPYAGEAADVTSELHGVNEAIRGGMQTVAPALVTQPEALAVLPAYGIAGELAQRGLEKAGVSPEVAELTGNAALLGGGMLHGSIGEPKPEFGTFEQGASEPVVHGDVIPDYVKSQMDNLAAARAIREDATARQARINAPVNIPKLPETTQPPLVLPGQRLAGPKRSPMDELSAQAAAARAPQEFRQQLTQEISDAMIKRLRDEGLLEAPKTNVVDRRTMRPEDVEPYERPRTFIGGENIPASVVPRGRDLSGMLDAERPARLSAEDAELGFRPASPSRMLPPASAEDTERIEQGERQYNAQPQPRRIAEPTGMTQLSSNAQPVKLPQVLDQEKADRMEMGQLEARINRLIDQRGGARSPERFAELGQKLKDAKARFNELDALYPKPEAEETPVEDERPKSTFAGQETAQSTGPRASRTPTFDSMPKEHQEWMSRWAQEIPHLPQSLRESEMQELGRYGQPYDLLKEKIAKRHMAENTGRDFSEPIDLGDEPAHGRERAETQQMARAVEPNLEALAEGVRPIDPDLASFLTDAAKGHISTHTGTKQDQLSRIEEKIFNARQAIEFGRAVDELGNQERESGSPETHAGETETLAAGRPTGQGSRPPETLGQNRLALPESLPSGIELRERAEATAPPLQTDENILPGLEGAVAEQRRAVGVEQGRRLGEEAARPLGDIEERAGKMERESPLFRGTEASPQNEMFPPRRGEAGFVAPKLARDLITGRLTKDAYQKYVADPIIEKGLGLGDKYAKIEEADPNVAAGLHLLDNAPSYFRAKAAQTIHNVIGDLSREQERLFTLMADTDSRENLRTNHPDEYQRAQKDPAIQDALKQYRPIEQQLTQARRNLGGQTLDQDYLRRVYDEHVAGIGKEFAPGGSERSTTAFDRIVRPQNVANLSREAAAEYHYRNGLHEFGPAFGTKYIATNLAALRDGIARDFISKATEIKPGDSEPKSITYNGEKYYRPDIAREMRDAGQKNVKAYDRYDPTAGVKYPPKATSRFLGPQEVTRALNDYGSRPDEGPGGFRRFLQEQTIGFGFGIPHVANILRRVTQSAPLGAANPLAWVRGWNVAFGKELRDRGISGLNDPTFDRLMQRGSITTGESSNLKAYWGGNLNPANWARTLAGVGHKLIFDPKSFAGFGGVDQRARLYIADLVRSQNPNFSEDQIARAVNTQLGDYNRANWNDRQKTLSKFMLFPGWDTSSIRWVIEHPIKTTVPPALIVWTANQVLNSLGQNRDEDASDISNVHFGDRSIGVTLLRESMGRNLLRPALNYAQSRIRGESNARGLIGASRGIAQGAGGLVGTLRPDLTAGIDLAMNRKSPFGGQELVSKDDYTTPGKVLPNRALEKQAALVVRHAVPALDRMLGNDESVDFRAFAGSNIGLPNYQDGAEQRLKQNAAEAMEVSQAVGRLAKTQPEMARQFIRDPDNAAYSLFRNDLDSMTKTLKRIDQAEESVRSAKNLRADERSKRLDRIDQARQNLLKNADGLDRLLFQRKQQNRVPQPSTLGGGRPLPNSSLVGASQ
jgi:hypothetical protein